MHVVLGWAVLFLLIALAAAALGFGGIVGSGVAIAKVIFFVAIVVFVISMVSAVIGEHRFR